MQTAGYIYQASLYCDECGKELCQSLVSSKPEDVMDYSSYDSDDYPKSTLIGESDSPEHCNGCGVFLHNELTGDGYRYVQEKLNATGLTSIYVGSMSIALKEWATWYTFDYWTAEECAEDGRHQAAGWYSQEMS